MCCFPVGESFLELQLESLAELLALAQLDDCTQRAAPVRVVDESFSRVHNLSPAVLPLSFRLLSLLYLYCLFLSVSVSLFLSNVYFTPL